MASQVASSQATLEGQGPAVGQREELQLLQGQLEAIQSQFVTWTKRDVPPFLDNIRAASEAATTKAENDAARLRDEAEAFRLEQSDSAARQAQRAEDEEVARERLAELARRTDAALQRRENLEAEVEALKERNRKQRELVNTQASCTGELRHELEKSVAFFRERLGLQFKKISGGRLQIIFTSIDSKDINRPYIMCVRINDDNTYSVTDVEPAVPHLQECISELNRTNNFGLFIRSMRAAFKASLKK